MIKEYIKGSILDAPQKYIAHGVNCQNVMGSGVARVIFTKYPKVKEDYHNAFIKYHKGLGDLVESKQDDGKVILNCFTQEYFGREDIKYVSYDAVYEVFNYGIQELGVKEVAIPKIGCGLAGGNWDIVSQIIEDATGEDLDVYVYYLKDSR